MNEDILLTQVQRLGKLPVSIALLEAMFCLPEGYHIVNVSYDAPKIITFLIESEHLPEATMRDLPRLDLRVTVDSLPSDPDYRKVTTEVIVP